MKKLKNKKSLLFGGVLCAGLAVLIIAIAYNRDSAQFANNFELGVYKTVTTEEFVGPENWAPCEEVEKTVKVKNEGDVDVAVRISYEEYWGSKQNPKPSEKDGVRLVNIVFQNETDWELKDGYYYYKYTLAPGEESNSLFQKVVLNCEANLAEETRCIHTSTGVECEPNTLHPCYYIGGHQECDGYNYDSTEYHLNIKVETIQADAVDMWHWLYHIIAENSSSLNSTYTEKGKNILTYRSKSNGNIIWSNMCWLAIRTTYTNGVKMIYNGLPSTSNGQQICNGDNPTISLNGSSSFKYNTVDSAGYMYGTIISTQELTIASDDTTTSFILSNAVERNGDTYTLDTSEGQFISGTEVDRQAAAKTRYHYFCTDGSSVCDSSKIGYIINIHDAGEVQNGQLIYIYESRGIIYYPLGGYDDVADMVEAMNANEHDSNAKATIESWFEANNLDDDDLEDAIFCNDRTLQSGPLASPEDNLGKTTTTALARRSHPTLDCANINDSFTKDDTINGNGKLSHKVGLLTADEIEIQWQSYAAPGTDIDQHPTPVTIIDGGPSWTMTPADNSSIFNHFSWKYSYSSARSSQPLRPAVSLKTQSTVVSGNGAFDNPYVIE